LEKDRIEEALAIEEMEIATKQLRAAYSAVFNKFARIAKNPNLKINPSDEELSALDVARRRFDAARSQMDKIVAEIQNGTRLQPKSLEGMLEKPSAPVSIEQMNKAIEEGATKGEQVREKISNTPIG
jgi:hypothetical protein